MRLINRNTILFFIGLVTQPTWAMSPAANGQLLCLYDSVVEATVVSVSTEKKCIWSTTKGDCLKTNVTINVNLKIDDVIGASESTRPDSLFYIPKKGETYKGHVNNIPDVAFDDSALKLRLAEWVNSGMSDRFVLDPESIKIHKLIREWNESSKSMMPSPSLDEHLNEFFLNQRFIFGISFENLASFPFRSRAWLLKERPFIIEELGKSHQMSCAKPSGHN